MPIDTLELGKQRAEELGLKIGAIDGKKCFYDIDDIHKLLGEAEETFAQISKGDEHLSTYWMKEEHHTHQALLIGIRPIVQESEERKLLRELAEHTPEINAIFGPEFMIRAKALLEREK